MADKNKVIDIRPLRVPQDDPVPQFDQPGCVTLDTAMYQGRSADSTRRLLNDIVSNMREGATCVTFTPLKKNDDKDK